MNNVTRIVISCLCAALALSSCQRKNDTTPVKPEQEPANVPVGFTAASQATWVKALADDSLAKYHKDFGVWGIAHQDGNDVVPYILWDADKMTQVVENPQYTGIFKPVVDAYWLSGYSYNFIAVAPYEAAGPNNSTVDINKDSNTLSFTYDMSAHYEGANYDFDLLGAAATKKVNTASEEKSQELVFWHLLSQININVTFATDITGNVSEIRLLNVDTEAEYVLSFDDDGDLAVSAEVVTDTDTDTDTGLTFSSGTAILHIVPQDFSDFKMYLDFTQGDVSFTDFFIDVANASGQPTDKKYGYNEAYNWNITIGSKEDISFNVKVANWDDETVSDYDDDETNNEIEII